MPAAHLLPPRTTARLSASGGERLVAALASALILMALAAVLVIGLRPPLLRLPGGALVAITTTVEPRPPAPPPPPPQPRPAKHARDPSTPRQPAGASAARATPAAVIAPPARVVLLPPPMTTDAQAAAGSDSTRGAAATGTGSGAAGAGAGPGGGAGGSGDGTGAGVAVHARQVKGRLSPRDVPDGLIPPGGQASVAVRFTITPEGGAAACAVIRTSGSPAIDAVPCPLLEARYRFRPARDRAGKPVAETIEETHTWFEPAARP